MGEDTVISMMRKNIRFISSKELITYLRNHISNKHIEGMFYAGSLPELLIPGSDLDIFIVMKQGHESVFLDELTAGIKSFFKRNRSVTYTFFRGPIKYKYKGLVHFLCYNNDPRNPPESIYYENNKTLRMLANTSIVIIGKPLRNIIKRKNLAEPTTIKKQDKKMIDRYNNLVKHGFVKFRRWTKTPKGWMLRYHKIQTSTFLKNYLIHYYRKHLG